jgi:hypothetical protein
MRKSKPILLFVPNDLIIDLDNYLEYNNPPFKVKRVYFYVVIHQLIKMQIMHKNDEYHFITTKHLKEITCNNIGRYVKILRDARFLLFKKVYINGNKAYRYKLKRKYAGEVSKVAIKTNSKTGKKIIKSVNRKKAHYNRQEPHIKVLRDRIMNMELDYKGAYKWIENNAEGLKKLSYITAINHIEDKRFRYASRNRTNKRLDTNLTNLKSDFKQFIIGDYVSIDLKNSQPFLLAITIYNIITNIGTYSGCLDSVCVVEVFGVKGIKNVLKFHQNQEKGDLVNFRNYFDATLNGVLYEEFMKCYPKEMERKEAKEMMFAVLFSRNKSYDKQKKAFARVYPFVDEVARLLKAKDHRTLPIYLQKLESYLFIDCIAKELINEGIIPYTIHDSVIVKKKDEAKTIEIMNRVFMSQIGFVPTFSIEDI